MNEIYEMPVKDRKFFISIHNKQIENEKNSMNKKR